MDLATLKATYLTTDPPVVGDSSVTPLVDTVEYHAGLDAALASVGAGTRAANQTKGDFIHIHGWWLGLVGGQWVPPGISGGPAGWNTTTGVPAYPNPASVGPKTLLELLVEKARAGVDVRVMGWCHHAIINSYLGLSLAANIAGLNVMTLESIRALRNEPEIGGRAILNVVHHTGGAAHAKLVVVGDNTTAVGFTGGSDFVYNRLATSLHPNGMSWHDIMARVEGPAVQGLYDWFKDTWDDATTLGGRPRPQTTFRTQVGELRSTLLTSPPVAARTFTTPSGSKHHAQSLRTLPAHQYATVSFAGSAPASAAPVAGEFKLKDAWQKAISAATRYIYMEDQSFQSTEILGWVNARLKAVPDLRVVLVTGGGTDPNDAATDTHAYLCQSLNGSLLAGLDAAQLARVRMFRRWGDNVPIGHANIVGVSPGPGATTILETDISADVAENMLVSLRAFARQGGVQAEVVHHETADPTTPLRLRVKTPAPPDAFKVGPVELHMIVGLVVHSKTTIVDDHWAMIGSANCMRRSLYTDKEHAVAFVDEGDVAVKEYRKKLWDHHFRHLNPADWDDLDAALHSWEPSWFAAGASPGRPPRIGTPGPEWIEPIPLPLQNCKPLPFMKKHVYDTVLDVDSRDPWGFVLPPIP